MGNLFAMPYGNSFLLNLIKEKAKIFVLWNGLVKAHSI
jgi:hypothetical protein